LLAWLASLAGTLGSLFFSEVMQLQPCLLCWYQRIAMFPLVLVLASACTVKTPAACFMG
jgi:disulfide bond formation protein DsbB